MSGFSDAFYAAATERLTATALPGPKSYYVTAESPDVWFAPTEVRGAVCAKGVMPCHAACGCCIGCMHAAGQARDAAACPPPSWCLHVCVFAGLGAARR